MDIDLRFGEDTYCLDGDNFVKNPTEELQKVEQFLGLKSYISQISLCITP